jgi:hypothetical protein
MLQIPQEVLAEWAFGLVSAVFSLLLLGNLWFIRKLISKVDLIDPLIANMTSLTKRLDEICGRVEIINELRVEIAAIKARFSALYYRRREDAIEEAP